MRRFRGSPQWASRRIGEDGPEFPGGIEEREAAELMVLAANKHVLEIGSAYGYSTVAMALVAHSVVAVDPHTGFDSEAKFRANLEAYGVTQKVEAVVATSQAALPQLYAVGLRFGLIFIDGDHLPETVRHDLTWARRLIEPGGAIACHDYLMGAGTFVRQACLEWRECDRLVETLGIYEGVSPAVDERAQTAG